MMTPHLAERASEAEKMLCVCITNTLVLPKGIVLVEAKLDMRGCGLNFSALPKETLYQLQDGVTAKLCSQEGHTLQVLSKLKLNLEQLSL